MAQRDLKISNKIDNIKIDKKSIQEFKDTISTVHQPKWYFNPFVIILGFLLFILPGAILWYLAKEQKHKISRALSSNVWGLYRRHFEDNFKNIEYVGAVAENSDIIYNTSSASKRPNGVPGDARSTVYPGVIYKIYDKTVAFNSVNWVWTRSNGKTTTTYSYFYLVATGFEVEKKFSKFNLTIAKKSSKLFAKKEEHQLGSQEFNKKFHYNSSDPIMLRKIMRPSTQALFIDHWGAGKSVGVGTPEFYLKQGKFIAIATERSMKYRPFILNFTLAGNIDGTVDSVVKDVETDLEAMQFFLLNIASLKELLK